MKSPETQYAVPTLRLWILSFLAVFLTICTSTSIAFGQKGVEKLLTAIVLPVGMIWLSLTAWMVVSCFRGSRGRKILVAAGWLIFTAVSTGPVPNYWLNHIESKIPPYHPENEPPLDVLVVLGGGTSHGPTRSEVGVAGDRVVYAAQLFIQGHAKHLITTGSIGETLGEKGKEPYEQTIELWTGLGIDGTAISTLPGRNTSEEIQNLAIKMKEFNEQRVGVLTSASHMPRAMRLANAAGLKNLVPVPANYNGTEHDSMSIQYFLPSAKHLDMFSICQREWMGQLIGR